MSIKVIISISILIFAFSGKGFGQGWHKGLELSFGYGFQPQDRRLFDLPHQFQIDIIENEDSYHDFQYDFLLNKHILSKHNFNATLGLGYSAFISKFSRPFDHNYFTHDFTKPLFTIGTYTIHNLKLETTIKYKLIGHGNSAVSIIFPINLNFAFNKQVKRAWGNWRMDRWGFEFNKGEIFSGLEYRNGRIRLSVTYRVFNLQEIDQVVFNYILFGGVHSDFLESKTETLNLNKLIFSVGYQF